MFFLWAVGCCLRLDGWGGHWLPFPPHYRVWNEQLFHNVFINLWHSTIDAPQPIRRGSCSSGTLCCRSVSASDLFAWMLVGVTTQRGGSLHLNFAHILTVINLKYGSWIFWAIWCFSNESFSMWFKKQNTSLLQESLNVCVSIFKKISPMNNSWCSLEW